ncbi:MAG: M28 family peptidase [Cyclobacteriaceae bacterium]
MKKLLVTTLLLSTICAEAQGDKAKTEETVAQSTIKSHIGFLASDALRGRDTGSPELDIAAEYVKSRFVQYGVSTVDGMDSYFQDVPLKSLKAAKEGTLTLADDAFLLNDDFLVLAGGKGLSGPIVFVDYGSDDDLKKANVEGKIAVALSGDGVEQNPRAWFTIATEKRKRVKEKGAIALVELYNSTQLPWNFLVRFLGSDQLVLDTEEGPSLTHIWMNRSQEDLGNLKKKGQKGSLSISGNEQTQILSKNVVGFVEGTDPNLKDEVVVYSAHYDHVGVGRADAKGDTIYNGARDNAVGTVTVLSAAENIAKYPTRRSALFVLFTGEEKGLLGSQYFIDNSPVEHSKMVYCFNSDNGGYNDTSIATIIGLGRTTAGNIISESSKAFGLLATDDPAPEQGLFDRSDNVRFAAKGIPAPTFSLGFTAFDDEIGKYYHQPGDEPETLDYDYLEKFFKAYVLSCRVIANSDETPFWVEGDKYYDVGVQLYKR